MINFEKVKNARSKDIEKSIDFDVMLGDGWIPYTATPNDPVSMEIYQTLKKGNVDISPGEDYDWNGKWVPYSQERIRQLKSIALYSKTKQVTDLTAQINALSDKIEFGFSVDVEADKAKLLALRKDRALLV